MWIHFHAHFFCSKNIMIWVFPTASKRAPFRIIRFIINKIQEWTTPMKICESWLRYYIGKLNIFYWPTCWWIQHTHETTGGDSSWLNVNTEIHNKSIHNMVRADLLYSNQHTNNWCYASDMLEEDNRFKIHSSFDNTSPQFSWFG